MNLKYVNFLACILLASDWFKDNQLLSQLTHAHYRDTVPLKRGIWHHRHRLLANGLDTMFFCYSSFKIFASLMTVSVKSCAVLSSRFDINIFGWLFFRFVFCDKNRSKYSLHYNSWPTISSEENRANHQLRLSIFWPNINMSWKGQNVACCFNVFYSFLPSGTPLGKFMTSKYNLIFILFFIYWGYSFLVVFIFVCARTVLFLNEHHTTTRKGP